MAVVQQKGQGLNSTSFGLFMADLVGMLVVGDFDDAMISLVIPSMNCKMKLGRSSE